MAGMKMTRTAYGDYRLKIPYWKQDYKPPSWDNPAWPLPLSDFGGSVETVELEPVGEWWMGYGSVTGTLVVAD